MATNLRPVRYRGIDYPVIKRFYLGGRTYLAIAKLNATGRRAFQVYDPGARTMRALHILPESPGALEHIRTLQRLTQGDNEIIQIIEVRRFDGQVGVVLPWIDGFNLRSVLLGIREKKNRRIAAPEAVRLVKGVAHGLAHLHRHKQIVHGDIKPANLLLTKRTSLVLIDFGNAWPIEKTMARHDGDGVSPGYASPEQMRGDKVIDRRTDQFSLGVVLYELLTGQLPFDGHGGKVGLLPGAVQSKVTLMPASQISPDSDKLSQRIWATIDALLLQSLAIDPDARFETTHAWLDAWSKVMGELQQVQRRKDSTPASMGWLDWLLHHFRW